jgi:hypothetical protein
VPVSILNVNPATNPAYYFANTNTPPTSGMHIAYNGLTVGLQAYAQVVPCQVYTVSLKVADAMDRVYDSGVFIEKVESDVFDFLPSASLCFPGCPNPTYNIPVLPLQAARLTRRLCRHRA